MRLDQDDLAILQVALCGWRVGIQDGQQPTPDGVLSLYQRSHTLLDRVSQALDAFKYGRMARDAAARAKSMELRGGSLVDAKIRSGTTV